MFYWFGYFKDSKLHQTSKLWSVLAALQREFGIKCSITILKKSAPDTSLCEFLLNNDRLNLLKLLSSIL